MILREVFKTKIVFSLTKQVGYFTAKESNTLLILLWKNHLIRFLCSKKGLSNDLDFHGLRSYLTE